MKINKAFNTKVFNNWIVPSEYVLCREYQVEYMLKKLDQKIGNVFPTVENFIQACYDANKVHVSREMNKRVQYRSNTTTKQHLIDTIKRYKSYPEFRNERTVEALYSAFNHNNPMEMPIVLILPNNKMRVFSGNTRMDIAFQLGISPKVLLISV